MEERYTVQFFDECILGSRRFDSLTDAFSYILYLKRLGMDCIELYWGPDNCIWKYFKITED